MGRSNRLPLPAGRAHLPQALVDLERLVAAVKGQEERQSKISKALATLRTLSRKEGIPLAIVGGLAAIHHGYERFTKDIDIVVESRNLEILTRVAPDYGIKIIWKDREGWHKLDFEGVPIDVVPEGRRPRKETHQRPFQARSDWGFATAWATPISPVGWGPSLPPIESGTGLMWFKS